jgi:RNA polymerase-binding transcription factor DksA
LPIAELVYNLKYFEENFMTKPKKTKAEMLERMDEINAQLDKTNKDLGLEMDHDMEDQATEVEQEDVYIKMESNLRQELAEIEFDLAEMEQNSK